MICRTFCVEFRVRVKPTSVADVGLRPILRARRTVIGEMRLQIGKVQRRLADVAGAIFYDRSGRTSRFSHVRPGRLSRFYERTSPNSNAPGTDHGRKRLTGFLNPVETLATLERVLSYRPNLRTVIIARYHRTTVHVGNHG